MLKLNKVTLVAFFSVLTSIVASTVTAGELDTALKLSQEDLISKYDTNGDGKLSKSEVSASNNSKLISSFDSLDSNKDGQLSADELAKF